MWFIWYCILSGFGTLVYIKWDKNGNIVSINAFGRDLLIAIAVVTAPLAIPLMILGWGINYLANSIVKGINKISNIKEI